MFSDTEFRAASEAAHSWCRLLAEMSYAIERDNYRDNYEDYDGTLLVYGLLGELEVSVRRHAETIVELEEQLAGAASPDSYVRHHGLVGLRSYASGHQAITDIARMAVLCLLGPVQKITDEKEWRDLAARLVEERSDTLFISSEEASLLQARILRERARLIQTGPTENAPSNKIPRTPRSLDVDIPRKILIFDGIEFDVSSEQALRWVKVLAANPGEWISGPELGQHDAFLQGVRTDRLKLPEEIKSCIDSDPGKGSRIRL